MSRALTLSLALMTTLGGACAAQEAGAGADGPRPGAAVASARTGTFEWHTYTGDAGTRRYKLFVPGSYDRARPAPLVVMLHGCTQDPDDFARGTRFNEIADSAGVLVAYPEQTAADHPQKCWTWYEPEHRLPGEGQAGQIAGITREVMASHAVDPARVYIAGMSAGGAMAMNVAVTEPLLYAAVGTHSGILYSAAVDVTSALEAMRQYGFMTDSGREVFEAALQARGVPLPLISFHGRADPVVAPANAEHVTYEWAASNSRALKRPDLWRGGHAAVGTTPVTMGGLQVRMAEWPVPVVGYEIEGLGHAWSGGSPQGTYTDPRGPDASREMLRFFLANPKP